MHTRVTFAAPGEIPDSLVALVTAETPPQHEVTGYGQRLSCLVETPDPDALRSALRSVAGNLAVGVITGPLAVQDARLVLMDVDSTLTTTEAIDLLAEHAARSTQVAEITEQAMRGELDFESSLRQRVAALRGLPTAVFDEVAAAMTLSPGAEDLVISLKQRGIVVGVTSGGFTQLVAPLAQRLGLDFFHANDLETEVCGGLERLTGRVIGTVVDRDEKARDLLRLAHRHDIPAELCVAVGDGANDIAMFAAAGLSISYCGKPVTAEHADAAIGFPRLDAVSAFAFAH